MYYFKSHIRIVSAFVIREIASRYGRSPGGYLWAFLEPIALITVMSQLMGVAFGRMPPVGESFALFYATGFLAFSSYKAMEGYLTSSLSANQGLLKYPNVAAIDTVVARFVLQGGTSIVVALVILGCIVANLARPVQVDWLKVIEAVTIAWTIAMGIALANITLFFKFPLYQKAYAMVTRPLFLLSGVFLVPSSLPHPLREWMLLNPITHIVILYREGFYGGAGNDGLDMSFLLMTAGSLIFVGLFIFTFWPVSRLRD
ncbi:ABC transporter permease [Rhizobium sp. NFR12]|uniref:ABC transporter permease n=1 Tax=Rhizobium sp. NFR12 TaxID=1566261 RepID=UPI0008A7CC11|nr:ABC transporter permease [Rhizobium sp. NFR12]SEH27926.1 capsular polysaccharide transport system permease protein [Rhizobium sp. NFR12]